MAPHLYVPRHGPLPHAESLHVYGPDPGTAVAIAMYDFCRRKPKLVAVACFSAYFDNKNGECAGHLPSAPPPPRL